jgi:Protein of unknown function (DUF2795)
MIDARWGDVAEALNDLDFPATKNDVVEHARQRGAPGPVQRLLRGLPVETYANMSEIRKAAPPDPAVDEGLDASGRAAKARGRRDPHGRRVAEHLRDVD